MTRPAQFFDHKLTQQSAVSVPPDGVLCLALCHNEAHILPEFLNHYRGLGAAHFLIVDDHSTDETMAILSRQKDVSIFIPEDGSTYRQDKIDWRCALLDHFADGRWVLLPDLDEHLVFPNMESGIDRLAKHMDAEGSEALFTVMLDMYGDISLRDHIYNSGALHRTFPYFDGPAETVGGYRLMPPARSFRARFATPQICAYGGLRERLFHQTNVKPSALQKWLIANFANMARPLEPGAVSRFTNAVCRRLTKSVFPADPLSMTKLGLMRWRKGLRLPGGPHAVSGHLKLATVTSAYLHFKFTRGVSGIAYTADRGQHAGGAVHYKNILSQQAALAPSPVTKHSVRYGSVETLIENGIIRRGTYQ